MQSIKIYSHWILSIYTGIAIFPIALFLIYNALSAFASCCVTASNLVLQCNMTRGHETRSLMQYFPDWSSGTPVGAPWECKVVKAANVNGGKAKEIGGRVQVVGGGERRIN
jgi:hypothetical protein